ncbi:MAG: hypothetical protein JWN51_2896 [Phycisphaerales bacterium]|nr:hypothetical protein [Phycisphaerales bacterium]
MRRIFKWILPLMACAVALLVLPGAASAASHGVEDDGHFFSSDTIAQADRIIQDIKTREHHDVLVKTFDSIPDNMRGRYDPNNKDAFYKDWARQIGRSQNVNGILILATRNPGHLQIAVGQETAKRAFTMADRDALSSQMLAAFKEQRYDEGLLQGLQFIQSRMAQHGAAVGSSSANTGRNSPPVYSSPARPDLHNSGFSVGGLVCLGIGALLIVFLVIRAFNRNRGYGGGYGGGPPPPGGYPPGYQGGYGQGGYGGGGGGGGFGRGILGGLLGGALGAWGYDQLSGRGGTASGAGPTAGAGGGDFGASNPQDTDYSSTGGDFDSSSSSGGDFGGGGDSGGGGGDFGSSGGDFGGGGGDSGGGGGDF